MAKYIFTDNRDGQTYISNSKALFLQRVISHVDATGEFLPLDKKRTKGLEDTEFAVEKRAKSNTLQLLRRKNVSNDKKINVLVQLLATYPATFTIEIVE